MNQHGHTRVENIYVKRAISRSPWLSSKEAAEIIGVDVRTVYSLCKREGLRHARLTSSPNSVIRFRREWLDQWLEARAQVRGGAR